MQAQTAEFETKTTVKEDLPPVTAEATWFPGALPRETMRGLRRLDSYLELKWSPRFECWEVWHERNFKKYCFYRHVTFNGGFRPADRSLIMEVTQRAMWTSEGQEMSRNRCERPTTQPLTPKQAATLTRFSGSPERSRRDESHSGRKPFTDSFGRHG